ncbi:MAG: hypothetical protein ACXAEX_12315 [Promethearchaeota archaeon]
MSFQIDNPQSARAPALFAPASITLTSARTGATFTYGEVNSKIVKQSVKS